MIPAHRPTLIALARSDYRAALTVLALPCRRAALTALALAPLTGCAQPGQHPAPPVEVPPVTNPSPVQPTADLIDRCTALRDLSREALLSALGASSADVQSGLAYGPTTALDMVYKPATSPCRVYLQGDKVLLVYLGEEGLAGISPAALVKRFPPELSLASRAGKVFQHHIAASAGVAWSDDGTELALLELFAPTSLEDFQSRFYTAPGPFIK